MSRPSYLLLYFITISSTCSPAPTSCVSSLCAESMVTQVEAEPSCLAKAVACIREGVEIIGALLIGFVGFVLGLGCVCGALALALLFIIGKSGIRG